jgi:hypothetical protein
METQFLRLWAMLMLTNEQITHGAICIKPDVIVIFVQADALIDISGLIWIPI